MPESTPEKIELIGLLSAPAIRNAIAAMDIPPGSKGLDAGCGIGTHTVWLADSVGPAGKILGVDFSPENLGWAKKTAKEKGYRTRVRFLHQDLRRLHIPDNTVDWAWCADVIWPFPGMDPCAVLGELCRVVKPGGRIGILFWTTQLLLPGYPELEARLNLAHARTNPYLHDLPPVMHFMRAPGWMRSANLTGIGMKSFVAEVTPPFSREKRRAVHSCMSMFWGELETHVSESDWSLWQKLADPESPECIYDHPDYCALIVYTLFHAIVPNKTGKRDRGCYTEAIRKEKST